jgi:hypothetical protein
MKQHLKHLGKASLSAGCGTAVALVILFSFALVAEGISRAVYYFNSRRFIHPYLGETYKPLQERTDFTPEGEKAFVFTSNNYGFRGQNIPDRKPIGARYIFAIGESTTACNEYPHDRTWAGILESLLRKNLTENQIFV